MNIAEGEFVVYFKDLISVSLYASVRLVHVLFSHNFIPLQKRKAQFFCCPLQ